MSPDDERLAFTSQNEEIRGWVFPFDRVAGRLIGAGRPVTPENGVIAHLRLSSDGQSLLATDSHRAGTKTVVVMTTDLDTGRTSELAANARIPVGSRDGHSPFADVLTRIGPEGSSPRGRFGIRPGLTRFRLAPNASSAAGAGTCGSERPTGPAMVRLFLACTGIPGTSDQFFSLSGQRRRPSRPSRSASCCGLRNHQFWQARFSPDDRWISFVAESTTRARPAVPRVTPASGAARGEWTRIAADHDWPDKPRWSPDGKTLYFLSEKTRRQVQRVGGAAWIQRTAVRSANHFRSPTSTDLE